MMGWISPACCEMLTAPKAPSGSRSLLAKYSQLRVGKTGARGEKNDLTAYSGRSYWVIHGHCLTTYLDRAGPPLGHRLEISLLVPTYFACKTRGSPRLRVRAGVYLRVL